MKAHAAATTVFAGARWAAAATALARVLLSGCASLPGGVTREPSQAYTDVVATPLARAAAQATPDDQRHLSGLRLLSDGPEAIATRTALARAARKSLDVQYYLVAPDDTGRQFLRELRDAADRGVRVRLLIDDLHAAELDDLLPGLAAHENVQVRLFNPLPSRTGGFELRLLLSLRDFSRVNRRMHNKLFIADNSFAVTGGRNIANEYFTRSLSGNFIDMDVLAIGPAVRGLSEVFDGFWNSELSFPIDSLVSSGGAPDERRARFDAWADRQTAAADEAAQSAPAPSEAAPWRFAPVHVLADEPAKAAGAKQPVAINAMDSTLMLMRSARSEVLIVSPYFVPGTRGLSLMRDAIGHGIKVSVMTNSLAATDEPLAYWAYARYRADMLKMGVSLSELSPVPSRKFDVLGDARSSSLGSLHAKVTVVDRRWLLVGSMNMDGRSSRSNTEVGLVIDDAELAAQALTLMQRHWSHSHYRLRMADSGGVEWLAPTGTEGDVLRAEPYVPWFRRLRLSLLSLFVAEDLL
jgi:putative cardiolipin synthase